MFEENTPRSDNDVIVGPVILPVELIVPATSNLYPGVMVPIPTLPAFAFVPARTVT